jgi:hypothetical protein
LLVQGVTNACQHLGDRQTAWTINRSAASKLCPIQRRGDERPTGPERPKLPVRETPQLVVSRLERTREGIRIVLRAHPALTIDSRRFGRQA